MQINLLFEFSSFIFFCMPKRKEAKEKGTTVENPFPRYTRDLSLQKNVLTNLNTLRSVQNDIFKGWPTRKASMCSRRPWTTHRTDLVILLNSYFNKYFENKLLPPIERSSNRILHRRAI